MFSQIQNFCGTSLKLINWSYIFKWYFLVSKTFFARVETIVNKEFEHKIKSIVHFNERIIGIKIETKQTDTFIIQVYMPISSHKDE